MFWSGRRQRTTASGLIRVQLFRSLMSSSSSPSSSGQWCWERSWPGQCTQTRGTPQSARDGTGTCGGSAACSGSGAWRRLQSLCTPSEIQERERERVEYIGVMATVLNRKNLSSPRSSPGCTPPSSYPPAPGRWWWWEPRRCWRRRKGRRQSRWRRRWTSPSCCRGSVLCPPRSRPLNAAGPWENRDTMVTVLHEQQFISQLLVN